MQYIILPLSNQKKKTHIKPQKTVLFVGMISSNIPANYEFPNILHAWTDKTPPEDPTEGEVKLPFPSRNHLNWAWIEIWRKDSRLANRAYY